VKDEFITKRELFQVKNPFSTSDLVSLNEKIKRTQLIGHSQGVILRMQGISALKRRPHYAKILLTQSLVKFRQSLQAVPRNQRTLRNVGDVFHHLGKNGLSGLFYLTAIEVMPNDSISLYKYAYFMDKVKKDYEEAKKHYQMSIDYRMSAATSLVYISFLIDRKKTDEAAALIERVTAKFPENGLVHHRCAYFYHTVLQKYHEAEKHYKLAFTIFQDKKAPAELYKNYSDFLRDINQDARLSEEYREMYRIISSRSHDDFSISFRLDQ